MSDLKMNDLPIEIIGKVLRYLKNEHLENATLTCKLWNNLIESSRLLSITLNCRYPVSLEHCDSDHWIHFILTTNRRFGTIELYQCDFSKDLVQKVLEKHGTNVVRLFIWCGRINNLITFAEYLKLTPNLRYLSLCSTDLSEESDLLPVQILPELKKLKEMEIYYSDQRILKCFGKAKATTIKIKQYKSLNDCGLVDFLQSQDMLTSLTSNVCSESTFTLDQMGESSIAVPFQLTQLAISGPTQSMSSNNNFLNSQAKSLQKLEIGDGVPTTTYEFVLANLTKLNTLSVRSYNIPQLSECLKQNYSIRTLIIHFLFNLIEPQIVIDFLKKLPNIHSLILTDYHELCDLDVVQSLKKLESLWVLRIGERSFRGVQFANLKTLQIKVLCGKINWNDFTKTHSQLTELVIQYVEHKSYLNSDDIEQITTNVKLQSIRLGVGFVADERFFEVVRVKCGENLKVELHTSCILEGLMYNIDNNLLRMCDNIKCSEYFSLL